MLCLQLIDQARSHGLRRLIVETTQDWDDAIRLYHRLGFVQYQRVRQEVFLERDLFQSCHRSLPP
jgi:GNAT superfamily N-acetyltransferase